MNSKTQFTVAAFGLLLPTMVQAAEFIPVMDEVVITATKTETSNIGGTSVTVISAEEIEAMRHQTVEEALKSTPGLDIIANGGLGTQSSVFMRGADSKNTLVLVDGVMFNDPSSANRSANLANLTTDNIERIEVVRGPMSVLYGSNATAGVINIITKKGTDKPSTSISAEGGSYGTIKLSGTSSGVVNIFDYSLSLSNTNTDGFSIANDDNDRIPHNGNTSEDDGWKNSTFSGTFGIAINDNFDVQANLRYLNSEVDLDDHLGAGYAGDRSDGLPGSKDRHTDSEQFIGRLDIKNQFMADTFSSDLFFQASLNDRTGYDNEGAELSDFKGKSQEIGWQGTYDLNETNFISTGISFFNEEMKSSSSDIEEKDVDTFSLWGQDQISLYDSLELVAGLRYDKHDLFGDKFTYRIAPSYDTSFGLLLKASYGTGFRAPSLFELYSSYGNENLGAEESKGWDIGFEQQFIEVNIRLGLTYFEQVFDDRIAWTISQYEQKQGTTKTKGIETFIEWQPTDKFTLSANHTYNDTEDPEGDRLTSRPLNKVSLSSRYQYEKYLFNVSFRWVGERDESPYAYDANGNSVNTLDSYALVDVAVTYYLTEQLNIFCKIDNLFNEEYEEAWSYATPGLSGFAGAKYTF